MAAGGAAAGGFDPGHAGPVHDAQFDYYGRRLATAGGDARVKVFDVLAGGGGADGAPAAGAGTPQALGDLVGHEGPVWQVRSPFFPPLPPPRSPPSAPLPLLPGRSLRRLRGFVEPSPAPWSRGRSRGRGRVSWAWVSSLCCDRGGR